MAFELKITSDARAVVGAFAVEVQEGLWDLFDALAQTAAAPAEPLDFEIEMHRFTWFGSVDRVVVIVFPVVIDYRAKTVSVPWLLPVTE